MKDATGDVVRVTQQRASCGPDFVQLSGEDASALGFNAHGGTGCISVTANVLPNLCAQFQEASLTGNADKALELQDRLQPVHEALFLEPAVAGVKFALARAGRCRNEVRLPIVNVTEETGSRIKDAVLSAQGKSP